MFSQPHTAILVAESKDAYGRITVDSLVPFDCLIEKISQFRTYQGQVMEVGKGVIFTSASLTFAVGMRLRFDDQEFIVKKLEIAHADGEFHHWEIFYG